ncbi:MAG TPA: formate/nitrite transporter family protein [Chloroflexota bacterium]
MFQEAVTAVAGASAKKMDLLGGSLARYIALSMLAGAYVGLGIALIFAIGAPLAAAQSPFTKVIMGACFGIALSLVIFAGSELFTGNTMVNTIGALTGKTKWSDLGWIWTWSYIGNLAGSLALAWLISQSGSLGAEPQRGFVESVAAAKMALPFSAALAKGILANWLVCLAVWCATRTTNDVAKLIMIFWCLFGFIGAGYEHSVANMTLLGLALFQPHGDAVSWAGFVNNLVPVTLGNIIGGAVLVGGLYWFASPVKLAARALEPAIIPITTNGAHEAEPATAAANA